MSSATETKHSYTTTDVLPKTFGLYILYVDRWAEAISFYRDTLGWKMPVEAPNAWAEFETGGVRFALHATGEGETASAIDTHLSFFVKNVDETLAALEAKGIKITSQPQTVCEGTRCASFADPFGNVLHVTGA